MSADGRPDALYCLALDEAAAVTHSALNSRGIDSILLKGAGLARRLGTERSRTYGDVDLLVAPDTFDATQEVFLDLGYRPAMPGAREEDWSHWYERLWRTPGPASLAVDLHRGFHGVGDPEGFWAALRADAEPMDLAGRTVLVPDPIAATMLVALHAAGPGRSLRPRADLERALAVTDEDTWRAAAGLAERTRAATAFAFGLRRVAAGAALADRLRLASRSSPLHHVVHCGGNTAAYLLARAGELPTTRERVDYLAHRLVPSPAAMRYARPLARRGGAGLALAYLLRFGRACWQVPRAIPQLRRAVRRSIDG
ncbi:nucleotidyltransferase family protein [Micromonospora sp. C31]|uniref:nucleotidyltransferase family protein n=1 Tax=Micromonospora sp. C31 TaxID=2824876 RepID=UPI001B35C4E1|nr:nucleotidyltransferase family protein [Micromonospora sp. C31]MBQ1074979.1 nucleotidyltransferase family protein [Micromonospora sp. C31]